MSGLLRHVLQACGGQTPPHACARRSGGESLGEACPDLTRCLQAMHPAAPCALIRFKLWSDGRSSLPFTSGNFHAVQCVAPCDVREDSAPLFTIAHPQDFDRVLISLTQAVRTVSPWLQEYRIVPPEGGQRWLRTCLVPHRGAANELVGYGLIADISAEKECREELLALCDQGSIGVYRAGVDGRYISVNSHFARICGYDSPGEFLRSVTSTTDLCHVHAEERAAMLRLIQVHGSIQRYAMELRTKDGGSAWVSLNLRGIVGPQGRMDSYEGYCADITEQMRREIAQGRCLEFERTRFGQEPQDSLSGAKKPAGSRSDGLCSLLAYVRDAILWRVQLPKLP